MVCSAPCRVGCVVWCFGCVVFVDVVVVVVVSGSVMSANFVVGACSGVVVVVCLWHIV